MKHSPVSTPLDLPSSTTLAYNMKHRMDSKVDMEVPLQNLPLPMPQYFYGWGSE